MKRVLSIFTVFAMCVCFTMGLAVQADPDTHDIIFVVDDSAAMAANVPENVIADAVSGAISGAVGKSGLRVGVVTYGADTSAVSPLIELNTENKSVTDNFLSSSLSRSGAYSDYSTGIAEADSMLDGSENKAIIVISASDSTYPKGRTQQQSEAAVTAAADKKYPIYFVTLNPTDIARNFMQQTADSTGATAAFVTDSSEIAAAVKTATEAVTSSIPDPVPTSAPTANTATSSASSIDSASTISLTTTPGEELTTEIDVFSQAKSGRIRIYHSGNLQLGLSTPTGLPVEVGTDTAALFNETGYSDIVIKNPVQGKWILSVTDDINESIRIASAFEYKIQISFVNSSNVIYTGVDTIYSVSISADSDVKLDTTNLTVRLFVKDDTTSDYKDMVYTNGVYECTYASKTAGNKQISAIVLLDDGNIRSNPISVMAVANPDADNNLGLWVRLVLLLVVLIILGNIAFKNRRAIKNMIELKKMFGYVSIEVKQITSQPPVYRSLEEFGKKQSLYNIVQNRALLEIQEVWLFGVARGIKVTNTGTARIRFTHISNDPEGVTIRFGQGFKVFLSDNKTEIMVRYLEKLPDGVGDSEENTETQSATAAPTAPVTPQPQPEPVTAKVSLAKSENTDNSESEISFFGTGSSEENTVSDTAAPEISFGSDNTAAEPEISFGSDNSEPAPEISFGSDNSEPAPEISFGSDNSEPAPEISFGSDTTEDTTAETTTDTADEDANAALNYFAMASGDANAVSFGEDTTEDTTAESTTDTADEDANAALNYFAMASGDSPAVSFGNDTTEDTTAETTTDTADDDANAALNYFAMASGDSPAVSFGNDTTEDTTAESTTDTADEDANAALNYFAMASGDAPAVSFGEDTTEDTTAESTTDTADDDANAALNYFAMASGDAPAVSFGNDTTEDTTAETTTDTADEDANAALNYFAMASGDSPAVSFGEDTTAETTTDTADDDANAALNYFAMASGDSPAVSFGADTTEETTAESTTDTADDDANAALNYFAMASGDSPAVSFGEDTTAETTTDTADDDFNYFAAPSSDTPDVSPDSDNTVETKEETPSDTEEPKPSGKKKKSSVDDLPTSLDYFSFSSRLSSISFDTENKE